jgi:YidC/Oxa1 family membrane protein insertase
MDNKNVFIAIALSMSVLLFWGAFVETPKQENVKYPQKQVEKNQTTIITPSINETQVVKKISRNDSINSSKRIKIENNNIIGSLNLEGGLIDDISFKNHKESLKNNKNIEFLNPAQTENGFYIETGWTSIGGKIKVPSKNSIWNVKGNNILGENKPVILQWNNNQGIIFKKQIELDEKYLFKITQQVQNNTNNQIELYPYAQITRNKIPDDIQNFYISHEGFIGVFVDELKEDDYDDVVEKNIV